MKTILLITLLLAVTTFGQFNPRKNSVSSYGKYSQAANSSSYKGLDSGTVVADYVWVLSGFDLTSSGFTTGTDRLATLSDTLSGASDTVTFNFGNQFRTCAVVIRDTTGGSALVDSVKIETYNSTLNIWTAKATGLYDAGTGDILLGDCLLPGNGVTKKYYLIDLYPSQIRISWYYGANKTGRKVPIAFEGSN